MDKEKGGSIRWGKRDKEKDKERERERETEIDRQIEKWGVEKHLTEPLVRTRFALHRVGVLCIAHHLVHVRGDM